MSVDASLTIDFESYSEKIFDVIKLFNESGWIFRNDEMEYLPNLDNDDNFNEFNVNFRNIFNIVKSYFNTNYN